MRNTNKCNRRFTALDARDTVMKGLSIGDDHKTIIVIDHSPGFAAMSGQKVELSLRDSKTGNMRVAKRVEKSLWSHAVETVIEYRRIVHELFPNGTRLIRFVVSDCAGRFLTLTWGKQLISLSELLKSFALCGIPDGTADQSSCSIINGISMAIEAISELTELQKNHPHWFSSYRNSLQRDTENTSALASQDMRDDSVGSLKLKVIYAYNLLSNMNSHQKTALKNTGSITIFTTMKTREEIVAIERHITEDIINRNKIIKTLDNDHNFAPVQHLRVYIVCIIPVKCKGDTRGKNSISKTLTKINELISCSVTCARADQVFRSAIHSVIMDQYDLASTTIKNIPMKEEAQQGQSINYDVEIFHPRRNYLLLEKLGLLDVDSKMRVKDHRGKYETNYLSWAASSIKNRWNQFPRCLFALPVSPVTANSRPSICLTTFLLNGRNVMLEVLKQSMQGNHSVLPNVNQKLVPNLLMSHAGRIYMHTLWIGEHSLLDNKNLTTGTSVSSIDNLRTCDFGHLMKECHLVVPSSSKREHHTVFNEKARDYLQRITRFWPINLSDSFIYNIPKKFDPLLSLVKKWKLSDEDVNECQKCIASFVSYKESKNPLTAKAFNCVRVKNPSSREEQFQIASSEISNHLRNYANHSEQHLKVFNMFLKQCGLEHSDQQQTQTDEIISSSTRLVTSTTKFTNDSSVPIKCPPAKKFRESPSSWLLTDRANSPYEYFLNLYQKERWLNWKDFVGRRNATSNPAILYPSLEPKS